MDGYDLKVDDHRQTDGPFEIMRCEGIQTLCRGLCLWLLELQVSLPENHPFLKAKAVRSFSALPVIRRAFFSKCPGDSFGTKELARLAINSRYGLVMSRVHVVRHSN